MANAMSFDPAFGETAGSETKEVSVLVVGGGPAGLTTALSLAKRNIDVLLVERRDFTQRFPRAHLLNVRTMEVFHDLGVASDIYSKTPPGSHWHRVAWYTSLAGPTPLHGLKLGDIQAWGGGSEAERYAIASPREFANLPQLQLDKLLWEHACDRLPQRILAQHELVELQNVDEYCDATIRDRINNRDFKVRAKYVVLADGGRVSESLLNVNMHGPRSLIEVVDLFVTMDLTKHADPEALLTYFVSPDSRTKVPGNILSLYPQEWASESDQWRIGMKFAVGDPILDDADACIELIRAQLGLFEIPMEIHAVSHWQYEGVVADRFRYGPVFLVGDAAHRHPPTGGLGLNTAVQDADNLAWKLAAALDGHASDGLLDTYESERLPIAIANVEHALLNAGRHAPIREAIGITEDMTPEDGWKQVAIWVGDTQEGARRRALVADAIAANADDYSQLNVEAGFRYDLGAVIPDGTPTVEDDSSATAFFPSAQPGSHIPHVWLGREGAEISSVDLIAADGFTLFTLSGHSDWWRRAVEFTAEKLDYPIKIVVVGDSTDEDGIEDPTETFGSLCEIDNGGAILVRPDRHVAWRRRDPTEIDNLGKELHMIMQQLLHSPLPEASVKTKSHSLIYDAGEALRS